MQTVIIMMNFIFYFANTMYDYFWCFTKATMLKKYRTLDDESLDLHFLDILIQFFIRIFHRNYGRFFWEGNFLFHLLFRLFLVGVLGLIQLSKMVHLIYPKTKKDHNKYGNNSNTLNEKVHQVPGGKIQILIYCLWFTRPNCTDCQNGDQLENENKVRF